VKRILYLLPILIVSLFFIGNCESKIQNRYNFKVEYLNNTGDFIFKDEHLKDIADISYQLLEYIKNKDTDSIVKMCYDGHIMYDSMNDGYISKKNLYDDFHNKGNVYSLFFDSERYYKANQNYIDHHSSDYARSDYKLCLRDVLLKYEIFVDTLQLSRIEKRATVYLNWKNKKKSQSGRIGYSIGFVNIDDKWMIGVLLDRNAL